MAAGDRSGGDPPVRGAASALARPALVGPADNAAVDAVPAFSWRRVRRAVRYEFQFSADARFRSTLASFDTLNTSASVDKTVFDGDYYWRVRAIDVHKTAGRWSRVRTIRKRWSGQPQLLSPTAGAEITYPTAPLVLRWTPTPHAVKYEVTISADPGLAGTVVTDAGKPFEVSATSLSVPAALGEGTYYWAVTPMDANGLKGRRSDIGSFKWFWPSGTQTRLWDLGEDADHTTFVDPQFDWNPIPGAARYEVEVNTSTDFAAGSKVCCTDPTTGTSLSPTKLLGNNTDLPNAQDGYHWRVRAIDLDGNAGVWTRGPTFKKVFRDVVPTVPGLRVTDNTGTTLAPGGLTSAPIVDWEAVAGASSYEVQVVPWYSGAGCNWIDSLNWGVSTGLATSGTAWTPLAFSLSSPVPFPAFEREADKLSPGGPHEGRYCARVRARADNYTLSKRVVSDWTTLGGLSGAAFKYVPADASGPAAPLTPDAYLQPVQRSPQEVEPGMPLFRWNHVPGACGYFVAVASDQNFTSIVDVARTKIPAYAPRLRTYPDETTSYYWSVLPVDDPGCNAVFTTPQDNSPQTFQKQSTPPALLGLAAGADALDQPTFRWRGAFPVATGVEAAREYRLQVAADPSFARPIDDVRTTSTAFTSSSTYPADTELYWRVRANDENFTGLAWSETRAFRRRLRVPTPNADNPTRGERFPVFSWSPVQGAVSYDFHIEEEDGDKRDYTFRTTATSFKTLYGLGVFRWQVRANFPKLPFGTVPSAWSPVQTFTRFIEPPAGARMTSDANRVLLRWDPSLAATDYRVDISETNSFNQVLDSHRTQNTNYAPRMNQLGFGAGGRLYWRVAALDEGQNVGGFAIGSFKLPRGMRVTAFGLLQKRKRGLVTVSVTTFGGKPVKRAAVRASGAGMRSRARRTGRRGTLKMNLMPRRTGAIKFTVRKRGYRAARASIAVN
jgi:hypothetical protein